MQDISDMSRRLSIVYVWGLLVSLFMESSILIILYFFRFLSVETYFERWILTLANIQMFSYPILDMDNVPFEGF